MGTDIRSALSFPFCFPSLVLQIASSAEPREEVVNTAARFGELFDTVTLPVTLNCVRCAHISVCNQADPVYWRNDGKPIYTSIYSRCPVVLCDDWWSTSITDSLVLICQLKRQILQVKCKKKKVADWDVVQDETIQLFSAKSYIWEKKIEYCTDWNSIKLGISVLTCLTNLYLQ